VVCHLQLPAALYLTNPTSSGPSSLELFTKLLQTTSNKEPTMKEKKQLKDVQTKKLNESF
jgi:hypothetical protein